MGQRCGHEQKMHEASCFFTLTYDDEHVPADYSVKLRDWQLFLKRTRKRTRVKGLRFAGGGEYGELGLRPHYHGLFFNYDFPDKKLLRKRNGHPVYSSELLSELWENKGSTELGSVTHASAAYVARYSMKKVTGKRADDHYWRVSPIDGESHRVASEFFTSSRRPGLGSSWFDKFKDDVFRPDRVRPGVWCCRLRDRRWAAAEAVALLPGKLKERDQKAVKRARKRVYGSAGEGGCHAGAAEGPRVHQAGPYEAADSSAGMRQAGAT